MITREECLMLWDAWRESIAEGHQGSEPRDGFESLIDAFFEDRQEAADTIEQLEAAWTRCIEDWGKEREQTKQRIAELEAEVKRLDQWRADYMRVHKAEEQER